MSSKEAKTGTKCYKAEKMLISSFLTDRVVVAGGVTESHNQVRHKT